MSTDFYPEMMRRVVGGEQFETFLVDTPVWPIFQESGERLHRAVKLYEALGDRRDGSCPHDAFVWVNERSLERTKIGDQVVDFRLGEPGCIGGHERAQLSREDLEMILLKRSQIPLRVAQVDGEVILVQPNATDPLVAVGQDCNREVLRLDFSVRIGEGKAQRFGAAPQPDFAQVRPDTAAGLRWNAS